MSDEGDLDVAELNLQPPGAGLPLFEGLIVRYWIFPMAVLKSNQASALALFNREAGKILKIVKAINDDDALTPVLIPRLRGLEDSSRCWSPLMVVEHLLIVGERIQANIPQLHSGSVPDVAVDIADVKPAGEKGREVIEQFEQFCASFAKDLEEIELDRKSTTTLHHPWFGGLNAFQWLCLAAGHMRMHRQQIETILDTSREIDKEDLEAEQEQDG
jgi:hypothetical protein